MFSDAELAYLERQQTGRIATVSPAGQPDVAPVGFGFDGEAFTIRGIAIERSLKYRNVARGADRVAFVVDDYETADTSQPRGIKIHGRAEIVEDGDGEALRLDPERVWSWGVNAQMFQEGRRIIERRDAPEA